jgi:hypothetical protein
MLGESFGVLHGVKPFNRSVGWKKFSRGKE